MGWAAFAGLQSRQRRQAHCRVEQCHRPATMNDAHRIEKTRLRNGAKLDPPCGGRKKRERQRFRHRRQRKPAVCKSTDDIHSRKRRQAHRIEAIRVISSAPTIEVPAVSIAPVRRGWFVAWSAIASTVLGVSPLEAATSALSDNITGRVAPNPSVTAGSQGPFIADMLQEDQEHPDDLSEPAVSKVSPACLHVLGRAVACVCLAIGKSSLGRVH
jgi:hypothetical protein